MDTTHKVRIWSTERYKGKRKSTYRVRWVVDGTKFGESFDTAALADSFRSRLVSAARNGEAFDTASGLPVSLVREKNQMPWFDFACDYAAMKWPDSSPKYRKSLAESLMSITVPMLNSSKPLPEAKLLRKALKMAFSLRARDREDPELSRAIKMAARASYNVAELADPETLRKVLHALDLKLDGERAAANTVRLRRVTLGNAIDYAIERRLLDSNPLTEVKMRKRKFTLRRKHSRAVRCVARTASR
jgi:hypothetical protein